MHPLAREWPTWRDVHECDEPPLDARAGLAPATMQGMVDVVAYDKKLHTGEVSKLGACAQGGRDTCHEAAEFLVGNPGGFNMSACAKHLAGAVRTAEEMPAQKYR